MKKHVIVFSILLLAALALVLSGVAPVQAVSTSSQGGNYVLTAQTVDNSNALTGGDYQMAPAALPGSDGCCCKSNMPCIIR
jgi:hypothetical protein